MVNKQPKENSERLDRVLSAMLDDSAERRQKAAEHVLGRKLENIDEESDSIRLILSDDSKFLPGGRLASLRLRAAYEKASQENKESP